MSTSLDAGNSDDLTMTTVTNHSKYIFCRNSRYSIHRKLPHPIVKIRRYMKDISERLDETSQHLYNVFTT